MTYAPISFSNTDTSKFNPFTQEYSLWQGMELFPKEVPKEDMLEEEALEEYEPSITSTHSEVSELPFSEAGHKKLCEKKLLNIQLIETVVAILRKGEKIPEALKQDLRQITHVDLTNIRPQNSQTLEILRCLGKIKVLKIAINVSQIFVDKRKRENSSNYMDFKKIVQLIAKLKCLHVLGMLQCLPEPLSSQPEFFNDYMLKLLAGNKSIRILNLYNSKKITDKGISYVTAAGKIKSLGLYNLKSITNNGLYKIANLSICDLRIINNDLITNTGIKHIMTIVQLKHLEISGCSRITGPALTSISNLKNLCHFELNNCANITDTALFHIAQVSSLKHLEVQNNQFITDKGVCFLKSLPHLIFLNLSECSQITGKALESISAIKKLRYLQLNDCDSIGHDVFEHLKNCVNLRYAHLRRCKLITDIDLSNLAIQFSEKLHIWLTSEE